MTSHVASLCPPHPFRTAAVIGSGVMGAQIAAHLANAGLDVWLLDLPSAEGDRSAVARKGLAAAKKLNPKPFFTADVAEQIRVGNLDDDFARCGEVDWVIEAVVERLDVKQELMARLEATVRADAVVSTNTSGLPIAQVAAGRGDSFRSRFLGTHFFNPPRYLKLFELIPTADTDPAVQARLTHFARVHLGKGVVVAKDTPNFIGNRIGIYGAMQAIREVTEHGFTIEEIDALTGTLIGRPRSATFRTADLVGLDVMAHVATNLYEAVEGDESREVFHPPWLLQKLVERGTLGAKTKGGFYKKVDGKIHSVDLESMEYTPGSKKGIDVDAVKKAGKLPDRLRKLYDDKGRMGEFFRRTTLDLLGYAARRLPEIADQVVDVDRAMKLGFGWRMGPFEMWDALGFQRVLGDLRAARIVLPDWVDAMEASGAQGFYENAIVVDGALSDSSWDTTGGALVARPRPADEIDLEHLRPANTVWSNEESALLDLGDGVALFEFRSKMNAIGRKVVEGLVHALDTVEQGPWAGLVIGNGAEHFSVGANLAEMAMAVMQGHWDEIDGAIHGFQDVAQRIRYSSRPVVVATQGRVLGGACEFTMACNQPVLAAESYVGLVEMGAGLIPAGGGTMRMVAWTGDRAASPDPQHVMPFLRQAFLTVATAKVGLSADESRELGFVAPGGTVVMNADRRLHVAKREVLRLAEEGYRAPAVRSAIRVLGRPGRGPLEVGVSHMLQGGFVTEHQAFVANKLAWVFTGRSPPGPSFLHEQELLDLEREVFLSLLGEKATQKQIAELLTRNQPKAAQMAAKGLVSLTNVFRKKRAPVKR